MLDTYLQELARENEEKEKVASMAATFENLSDEQLRQLAGLDKQAMAPVELQLPEPPPAAAPGTPPIPEEPPMYMGLPPELPMEPPMEEPLGPETAAEQVAEDAVTPMEPGNPITPAEAGTMLGAGVGTLLGMLTGVGLGAAAKLPGGPVGGGLLGAGAGATLGGMGGGLAGGAGDMISRGIGGLLGGGPPPGPAPAMPPGAPDPMGPGAMPATLAGFGGAGVDAMAPGGPGGLPAPKPGKKVKTSARIPKPPKATREALKKLETPPKAKVKTADAIPLDVYAATLVKLSAKTDEGVKVKVEDPEAPKKSPKDQAKGVVRKAREWARELDAKDIRRLGLGGAAGLGLGAAAVVGGKHLVDKKQEKTAGTAGRKDLDDPTSDQLAELGRRLTHGAGPVKTSEVEKEAVGLNSLGTGGAPMQQAGARLKNIAGLAAAKAKGAVGGAVQSARAGAAAGKGAREAAGLKGRSPLTGSTAAERAKGAPSKPAGGGLFGGLRAAAQRGRQAREGAGLGGRSPLTGSTAAERGKAQAAKPSKPAGGGFLGGLRAAAQRGRQARTDAGLDKTYKSMSVGPLSSTKTSTVKEALGATPAFALGGGLGAGLGAAGTLGAQRIVRERREGRLEDALNSLPGALGDFYRNNPERRDEVADFMSRMPAPTRTPVGTQAQIQFAPVSDPALEYLDEMKKSSSAPLLKTGAWQDQLPEAYRNLLEGGTHRPSELEKGAVVKELIDAAGRAGRAVKGAVSKLDAPSPRVSTPAPAPIRSIPGRKAPPARRPPTQSGPASLSDERDALLAMRSRQMGSGRGLPEYMRYDYGR